MAPGDQQRPLALSAQTKCHLLALPPELRNYIYELVLTVRHRNFQDTVCISRRIPERWSATVLAILRSCKQINKEADAIFYHVNHLRPYWRHCKRTSSDTSSEIRNFIATLGHGRRDAIRTMTFQFSSGPNGVAAVQELRRLNGLQSLCIELQNQNCWDWSIPSVRTAQRDLAKAVASVPNLERFSLRLASSCSRLRTTPPSPMTRLADEAHLRDIEEVICADVKRMKMPGWAEEGVSLAMPPPPPSSNVPSKDGGARWGRTLLRICCSGGHEVSWVERSGA
ncbi:hypothetical protein LTR85_005428 [Meristemomyces frigidus]|nr:hypothetical protein LTR85_005428 [Meristemomyces frigidus]